jgi:3-phytase
VPAGRIQQLLAHPLINSRTAPASAGAAEAAALQGGANLTHEGDPRFDTADFADAAPGNLRADYVLPRRGLKVIGAGVFWPVRADPLSRLSGVYDPQWSAVNGFPTSDHRLVWLDLAKRH